MTELLKKFIAARVVPPPQSIVVKDEAFYKLADKCRLQVASPLAPETGAKIVRDFFQACWNVVPELQWSNGGENLSPAAYSLKTTQTLCEIATGDADGLRNALKSLRQLAESERGVPTLSHHIVPCVQIDDYPKMEFRGVHLCWFPETAIWEIEKQIRLAAYYKFNYLVLESWGMIKLESHPEFCWDEFAVCKQEIRRLVELGKELGVTLFPQFNLFGHATASRCGTGKHVLLDRHPEYASLFEPDGWTWCVSNPHTRRYLDEIVTELHELFDNPPYFHIGCDEAYNAGSCSICGDNYPEKLQAHIEHYHALLATRGTRVMMWHDMLLCRDDPRWDGYIVCGHSEMGMENLYAQLPKDIIICDWQYGYPEVDGKAPQWPTLLFFKEAGFDVLACPWLERHGTQSLGQCVAQQNLFGLLQTTWHRSSGSHRMESLFLVAAKAAWNPAAEWEPIVAHREYLNRHIREIAADMKLEDYTQRGSVRYQINPYPYQD